MNISATMIQSTPKKVRSKARRAAPAADQPAIKQPSEARGARRKRETREKLLQAAFRLMAERGMDAIAINQITEEADVGFGSFYNHFESKEDIYAAVMDKVFENFGDALDVLLADVKDPAEIIAISVRHTVLRARREPLWGKFLVREGFTARVLSRGLGLRFLRDLQKGVVAGRFKLTDPMMSFIVLGAGVLGAIAAGLELEGGERKKELAQLGLDDRELPERAAATMLVGIGVSEAEARAIAYKPLPVVNSKKVALP